MPKLNDAATIIARWWRQIRSSGRFVRFNPAGNHTEEFKTLLNNHNVPKRLSYYSDLALLADIEQGKWQAERFREESTHYSALNLFASSKITWEQKATVSDIIETTQTYGDFIAYPILDEKGHFSKEAIKYLTPFLHKGRQQIALTPKEQQAFIFAIKALPLSEQFIFVFNQQKLDENGSAPSAHDEVRDELCENYPYIRLLNKKTTFPQKEGESAVAIDGVYEKITSSTHTYQLGYQGILKLSFGTENALGTICYGKENWVPLVPQIGRQSIDDIDSFGQKWQRPTQSGESRLLGFTNDKEIVHDVKVAYTEVVAHDDFHRKYMSMLGRNVGLGISRIIQLARESIEIHWSKDLWLLRDFGFFKGLHFARPNAQPSSAYTTDLFSRCLSTPYQEIQIENCDIDIIRKIQNEPILFDSHGYPNHIAMLFIIDLVLHPDIWRQFHITDNEMQHHQSYPLFIKMAKYLKEHAIFNQDMKGNVIKFDYLMKMLDYSTIDLQADHYMENIDFDKWIGNNVNAVKDIDSSQYESHRNNKRVFLGFRKKPLLPTKPLFSLYADETLDPEPIQAFTFGVKGH
jgi:hypothetical protein